MDARLVGERDEIAVGRATPNVEHGGVVGRVGQKRDTVVADIDHRPDLEVVGSHRLVADREPPHPVPVGAGDDAVVGEPRGARDELDPVVVVVVRQHLCLAGLFVDQQGHRAALVGRLDEDEQPRSVQSTAAT